ncbi:MAG: glycosyltransferase family 2 protein [Phycisphaerae bacterium]|nr:glycosyltransferase family 2 protein [Phycisphaerae bacterium]
MEIKQNHQVSVVIPAYNAQEYIARAIDSVLTQTRKADEIIIVDDGSTDNTAEQVKRFGDKVRYIYQENAGASVARNTGINAGKYEWIAFLDGDDEFSPDRIEKQIALLKRNPHLIWVTANFKNCLCKENRQGLAINFEKTKLGLGTKEYFDHYLQACLIPVFGHTDTMLIKKSAILETGGFFNGQKRHNDIDLWFRISYLYPQIGFVNEPLAIVHLDIPNSITQTHSKSLDYFVDFIDRHLDLSEKAGQIKYFHPLATYMIRSWIRSGLFDDRIFIIRELTNKYNHLLDNKFKRKVRMLTLFPSLTKFTLRLISKTLRLLRLSKSTSRRPN